MKSFSKQFLLKYIISCTKLMTDRRDEGFCFGMLFFNVLMQISFPVSCILTMRTFERFFVCMGINMAGTVIWTIKFLSANGTSIRRRTKFDTLQCKFWKFGSNFYKSNIYYNVALLWYLAICLFKFDLILAACGQYGQWKGFSPVWVRICRIT